MHFLIIAIHRNPNELLIMPLRTPWILPIKHKIKIIENRSHPLPKTIIASLNAGNILLLSVTTTTYTNREQEAIMRSTPILCDRYHCNVINSAEVNDPAKQKLENGKNTLLLLQQLCDNMI